MNGQARPEGSAPAPYPATYSDAQARLRNRRAAYAAALDDATLARALERLSANLKLTSVVVVDDLEVDLDRQLIVYTGPERRANERRSP